jgi:molybdopterin converting factor small subunit
MSVEIALYGPYRDIVGIKSVSLDITSETALTTVIEMLTDRWPELVSRLYTGDDELAAGVIVLKNGSPVSERELFGTTVAPGDTLSVAPAITGG